MGGPKYIIYVMYGWAHLYIIILSAVHYGWAEIYYICYLQVGPPPYNIIINRTLRVGPDILYPWSAGGPTCIWYYHSPYITGGPRYIIFVIYGWAHMYIILLLAVHYRWAQIYYICYLRVGPPVYNIIISHTLQVGPNILYLLCTGEPKYNIYVIYRRAPTCV